MVPWHVLHGCPHVWLPACLARHGTAPTPLTLLCSSTASAMAGAFSSHSRVLPSTSVTTQVTITSASVTRPRPLASATLGVPGKRERLAARLSSPSCNRARPELDPGWEAPRCLAPRPRMDWVRRQVRHPFLADGTGSRCCSRAGVMAWEGGGRTHRVACCVRAPGSRVDGAFHVAVLGQCSLLKLPTRVAVPAMGH